MLLVKDESGGFVRDMKYGVFLAKVKNWLLIWMLLWSLCLGFMASLNQGIFLLTKPLTAMKTGLNF